MSDPIDAAVFWPAFKAAGFLRSVSVKRAGKPALVVDVAWEEPHTTLLNGGVASKEYAFEFQADDLPGLAEGDTVTLLDAAGEPVPKGKFSVREPPLVPDDPRNDRSGYWLVAKLTRAA